MGVFTPGAVDNEKAKQEAEKVLAEMALSAENRKKNMDAKRAMHADRRVRMKELYPHMQTF